MTLATSAARSARRAMLALVPRSPSSGPTARDALTASNAAFPRSCASSSSSRPWSAMTRGVSTRVVSCGNGDFGRLGHGGDGRGTAGLGMSAETFQPMTGIPQGLNVVSVSAGGSHTAVVTADGAVYTCGLNEHAQLGHSPDAGYVPILHPVAGLPPHDKVVSVSAGHHHTVCVTEGGELWAWGRNDTSQCGLGADAPSVVALPAWISGASPGTPGNAGAVTSVAAGPRHNLAVTDQGAVYTWGEGKEGVLGHGADESWRWGFWMGDTVEPAPRLVRGLAEHGVEVASAAAGLAHSVCVDRTGHVHAWGQGRFNQLGMGAKNAPAFTTTPTRVPALGRVRRLAAGGNFTVAVGVDGQMVSWGADGNGELGLGNSNDKRGDVPRPVHNTAKASFLSASAGWRHAAAVSSDGRVWTWGWGGSVGQHGDDADSTGGQLGLRNGQSDFWEPTRVESLRGKAKAVSCGFNHTVAVLEDP